MFFMTFVYKFCFVYMHMSWRYRKFNTGLPLLDWMYVMFDQDAQSIQDAFCSLTFGVVDEIVAHMTYDPNP